MTSPITDSRSAPHPVVPAEQWLAQRKALLAREKELTHLYDKVAEERRALPWTRVEKDYVFATPEGPRKLAELFDGHGQLIVQHLMFAPGWEQACPSCSYMADHADGMLPHLAQRDTGFVAVSRATLAEIDAFRKRMGWKFRWVSSHGSDFNRDFGVSFPPDEPARDQANYNYGSWPYSPGEEMPGVSTFFRDDDGTVFHTYSTYGRGTEVMMGTYRMLDLTTRGRDERDVGNKMEWVRHHDRYER